HDLFDDLPDPVALGLRRSWKHADRAEERLAVRDLRVLVERDLTAVRRTRWRLRAALDFDHLSRRVDDEAALVTECAERAPSSPRVRDGALGVLRQLSLISAAVELNNLLCGNEFQGTVAAFGSFWERFHSRPHRERLLLEVGPCQTWWSWWWWCAGHHSEHGRAP
ncbi:hypothetical protein PENTCL1PPCAC_3497, partial [Pristionchus entomophagus]